MNSLFDVEAGDPIASWFHVCADAVVTVEWSSYRPGVFIALDRRGSLHIWDLLKSDQHAMQVVDCNTPPASAPPPHTVALSHQASGLKQSLVAIPAGSDGQVHVHLLK
jgi:hypothetical protein